jgi:cathepsin L/cathepsin K
MGIESASLTSVGSQDVAAIKEALSMQPISAAVQASSFNFQMYSGGVFDDPQCGTLPDTYVLITGWGTDPVDGDYWLIKNSFGQNWGESGYMRLLIQEGVGVCGVNLQTEYPIAI